MKTKKEIAAILKEAGVGFVKLSVDVWTDKMYKDWNGKSYKGVKGGSIGPLTSTDAHKKHNEQAIDNLIENIGRFYVVEKNSTGVTFEIPFSETHKRTLSFTLQDFPSNCPSKDLDPGYRSYWLVLTTKDSKI